MEKLQLLLRELRDLLPQLELRENEPLSRHTSFRIGGPAALMAMPKTEDELKTIFKLSKKMDISPIILGAGTNVLAPDAGLDTLVIRTRDCFAGIRALPGGVIEADCGATLARMAVTAMEQGLSGLEFAHGIPGTVGGGVVMNAGAYGGELKNVVTETTFLYPDGNTEVFAGARQGFGYRRSAFEKLDGIILRARFQLAPGDQAAIRAEMTRLAAKRRASQPLDLPSAGSTFKRPEGAYAAALIEQAGLKGLRVGGAEVSEKHAGFVVNRGGATAADVLGLIEQVQQRVLAHSGFRLEPEVKQLGKG